MLGTSSRRMVWAFAAAAFMANIASRASADEPPPPPPPAPEAPAEPAAEPPTPPPAPAPTPEERRVVVEQAPPMAPAPRPMAGPCAPPPCGPCGPYPPPCCLPRDECGWLLDTCGQRYGQWEITLEGTFSFLGDPEGDFGETAALFGGTGNQLSWDGVDYDGELGGRVTIAYHLNPIDRLELRGGWLGGWDASSSQAGEFGASPGSTGLGDVSRPVLADLEEEADVYGAEFNWWTELACEGRYRFDVGVGGRWIQFDETARADLVTNGPGGFPVADGFVEAEALNTFLGGQLCAMLHVDLSPSFEITATAKGMVGNLNRDVSVDDLNVFAGGAHSSSREDDEMVIGLEAELGMRIRLTPRIAITAGYDLLFVDDVQRAHDAMDFSHSNSGAVQAQIEPDQLVVHTLFLGVNFNF